MCKPSKHVKLLGPKLNSTLHSANMVHFVVKKECFFSLMNNVECFSQVQDMLRVLFMYGYTAFSQNRGILKQYK
jgi:hypothetical protein